MKTLRTFRRAVPILATLLSGLLPAAAQGPVPSIRVSGSGFTVQTLREGGAAFGNRAYVWGVPAALQGWQFTQTDGGRAATLAVTPRQAGYVYAASAMPLPGWEAVPGLVFHYTDKGATQETVYRHLFPAAARVSVPQDGWAGTLVLAPALEQDALDTPVPSVVVDFSPAASRAYIGSPSLVILPSGDYVACHDLFGPGTAFDQTRVFVSRDRGRTWAHQADLGGAFWSTLFLDGGHLYLHGGAHSYHDANCLTFHRVAGFRTSAAAGTIKP